MSKVASDQTSDEMVRNSAGGPRFPIQGKRDWPEARTINCALALRRNSKYKHSIFFFCYIASSDASGGISPRPVVWCAAIFVRGRLWLSSWNSNMKPSLVRAAIDNFDINHNDSSTLRPRCFIVFQCSESCFKKYQQPPR